MPKVLFTNVRTALLLLAATAIASVGAQARHVDEIMHKSGIWNQFSHINDTVKAGAEDHRNAEKAAGQRPVTSEADFARLERAIDQAFSAERFRGVASRELASLSPAEEEKILEWLSSDLGMRITRREEKASEVNEGLRIEKGAQQYYRRVGPDRRKLCERMVAAGDVGEMQAAMMIDSTLSMLMGIAMVSPGADENLVADAKRQLEAQRPKILETATRHAAEVSAFVYQDFNDDDFEAYVNFLETPAARHMSKLVMKAMLEGFQQGGLELGHYLGKDAGKAERRS